mmetsp:Transcript_31426/g.65607  ORF Transcript_31426/g.65607 Transcript_31426/m.65607 type:complete len:206 (-) Transcript_31426:255-872(-)
MHGKITLTVLHHDEFPTFWSCVCRNYGCRGIEIFLFVELLFVYLHLAKAIMARCMAVAQAARSDGDSEMGCCSKALAMVSKVCVATWTKARSAVVGVEDGCDVVAPGAAVGEGVSSVIWAMSVGGETLLLLLLWTVRGSLVAEAEKTPYCVASKCLAFWRSPHPTGSSDDVVVVEDGGGVGTSSVEDEAPFSSSNDVVSCCNLLK